jgi:hypothetical protein
MKHTSGVADDRLLRRLKELTGGTLTHFVDHGWLRLDDNYVERVCRRQSREQGHRRLPSSSRSHLPVRPDAVFNAVQCQSSPLNGCILKSEALDRSDSFNIESIVNGRMVGQICGSSRKLRRPC